MSLPVFPHLPINLLIQAPADDDLLHGNNPAHGVQPADNLFRGVIRCMPAAQGYLDNVGGFLCRFTLAGCQGQQAHQENGDFFHLSV